MYGVGALDMKSGCAAIMLTLQNLQRNTSKEGSFRGNRYIISYRTKRDRTD